LHPAADNLADGKLLEHGYKFTQWHQDCKGNSDAITLQEDTMLKKVCFLVVSLAAGFAVVNCGGEWRPTESQLEFVSAQFVNKNTLELVYYALEEHRDLEYNSNIKIQGRGKNYTITDGYTLPVGNRSFHWVVRWNVSPDLMPRDTVTISGKFGGGPEQYVDVPNY
jgi:hypothetical protein